MNHFAQVRVVLAAELESGRDFDRGWYNALRSIACPEGAPPELRNEIATTKAVLAETKPYWRAAFNGTRPSEAEQRRTIRRAERKLRDLVEFDEQQQRAA